MAIGNTVEAVIGASLSPSFQGAFKQAEKAVGGLGAAVDNTTKAGKASASFQKLEGQVNAASAAFKQAENQLESVNKRLASGEAQTDELVNAWVEAEVQFDSARNKLKNLENRLESAKTKAQGAKSGIGGAADANHRLGATADQAAAAQQRLNTQLAKAEQMRSRSGELAIGATATAAAGWGMSAMLSKPLTAGLEMSQAASDLRAAATEAGEGFKTIDEAQDALISKVEQLGASTSFSSAEVAAAAKSLSTAGMDIGKTIDALPSVLSLSKAGDVELAESADILGAVMNQYKIAASETTAVTDVMAKVANSSASGIRDMGEAVKYVGGPANALNVTLEETSAMIGLLANAGVKGSSAGTAMRAMFLRLADPAGEAEKMIASLGVTVRDSAGNMLHPIEIFKQMQDAMNNKNWGSGQQLEFMSKVFGAEAITGAQILLDAASSTGKEAGKLQSYIGEIMKAKTEEKGLAERMAAIRMDNLGGDVEKFSGAMDGVYNKMFKSVEPMLRTVVTGLTAVVDGTNAWMEANPGLTAVLTTAAVAATVLTLGAAGVMASMAAANFVGGMWVAGNARLAASLGVSAASTGAMGTATMFYQAAQSRAVAVSGLAALAQSKLSTAIGTAVTWYRAKNAVLLTNIGLMRQQAVAAVTSGGMMAAMGNKVKGLGTTVAGFAGMFTKMNFALLFGAMATKGAAAMGILKAGIMGIGPAILGMGKAMAAFAVSNPLGWVILAVAAVALAIYKYWEPIKAFGAGVWKGISDAAAPIMTALQPVLDIFGRIGTAIGWVVDKVFGLIAPVEASTESLSGFEKAGVIVGKGIGILLKPLEWIADLIGAVAKGAGWLMDIVGDAVKWLAGDEDVVSPTAGKTPSPAMMGEALKPVAEQQARYGVIGDGIRQTYAANDPTMDNVSKLPVVRGASIYRAEEAVQRNLDAQASSTMLAATGTENRQYIDRIEVKIDGSKDPELTADALMRRLNQEQLRTQRELND